MAEILRYQTTRTLAEVPEFTAGLQLGLPDGRQVYLALSPTEFTLTFSDEVSIHYDLQGRFTKFVTLANYHRRALSGKILLTEKGGGIRRRIVGDENIIEQARERVAVVLQSLGVAGVEFARPENAAEIFRPLLEKAGRFDVAASRADAERFRELYRDVAILPPDQYNALVFQATEGCAYRECLFCDFYRGRPFRVKSVKEFEAHVDAVLAFHGESWRNRRSIFLGEANALTIPRETLAGMFQVLRSRFDLPINSFVDAFTRAPDFAGLAALGLRRVYVGMETGDDELLKWLRKPATAEGVIATVGAAKSAGVSVGVIVLLGAGGERFAEAHVRETVRVLNELALGKGDYIYFSPLVVKPGSVYDAPLLPAERVLEQEREIRAQLRFDATAGKPYLARYEIDTFVY